MNALAQVLHVVGAVFVVGPMVVVPMLALAAIRRAQAEPLRGLAGAAIGFGAGAVVVGFLGFAVMATGSNEDWSFGTPWILTSVLLFAVGIVVHFSAVVPLLRRASRDPSTAIRWYAPLVTTSGIVGVLMLAVVLLMVAQP